MRCDYYDAGSCRSCALMGTPYAGQLADKLAHVQHVLAETVPHTHWLEPFASRESGFRNKAKLVVSGPASAPTFGILDARGRGVDLRECGLYEPALATQLPALTAAVTDSRLRPYDVPRRDGELKHLIVTVSPDGELLVRFVLRSREQLDEVRQVTRRLTETLPVRVVSANLLPAHKAVLEGEEEIVLTADSALPMALDGLTLQLRPRSFFQTNTAVAQGLYDQARQWARAAGARSLWDLYCGVGGFALAIASAAPGMTDALGVELSGEAIEAARESAGQLGLTDRVRFVAGDASDPAFQGSWPDLVVVNPPRRGIGERLAATIEASAPRSVIYSSCNVDSLARDLQQLPSYAVSQARLFDMFPQTRHHEVMVHLEHR